jgi:ATP-dependent DNA helicase RecG
MVSIEGLLSRGRSAMLEFLPEPDADALAELIVAFANGIGGTIVVGMDEKGRVYPDVADHLEPALQRALKVCMPPFRAIDLPEWRSEEVPGGQITTITVNPTPYQLAIDGKLVFVRSGTINVPLSPEQVARSRRNRGRPSIEDEIVPGATLEDLDDKVIDEYHRNRLKRGPRGESFVRSELLRDAGAIDPSGVPTVAGLLLFGKKPQYFLPQVGVVVVRFRGTSVREAAVSSERYSRRVEIVGPTARVVERTWEILFEEIHQKARTAGLAREESYEYPPGAVREAMVNAICHRDYGITGQRVEIRLFDDRMEILSPGGLPGHITLDNLQYEHYSRNPRLVRGLYYWGYIEELGQGIDIIYEEMRQAGHPPPEFRDTGRSFVVTLYNSINQMQLKYGEQVNLRQMRALQFLNEHDRITNGQYQGLCPEVTAETLRLDLRDLVRKGILLKIGDKRGTYYVPR